MARNAAMGEVPATRCPVCLEAWDAQDHLPKFLSCHHSLCVGCVDELHRHNNITKSKGTPNTTRSSTLVRLLSGRTQEPQRDVYKASRIRCPLCRALTPVLHPHALQTNFYLTGLLIPQSMPRLVLWCETCGNIAKPQCTKHHLSPLPEKLRSLQDEVCLRAREASMWCEYVGNECIRHMDVYQWTCVMLRHAHTRVLEALTHTQHQHRNIRRLKQNINEKVRLGEELCSHGEPAEDGVSELKEVAESVTAEWQKLEKELANLSLTTTFTLKPGPNPPKGYQNTTLKIQQAELSLSLLSEDQREAACCLDMGESDADSDADAVRSARSLSLRELKTRRSPNHRRSQSFHQGRDNEKFSCTGPLNGENSQRSQTNNIYLGNQGKQSSQSSGNAIEIHHSKSPVQRKEPVERLSISNVRSRPHSQRSQTNNIHLGNQGKQSSQSSGNAIEIHLSESSVQTKEPVERLSIPKVRSRPQQNRVDSCRLPASSYSASHIEPSISYRDEDIMISTDTQTSQTPTHITSMQQDPYRKRRRSSSGGIEGRSERHSRRRHSRGTTRSSTVPRCTII